MNRKKAFRIVSIVLILLGLHGISLFGQSGRYELKWLENKKITWKINGKLQSREYLNLKDGNYEGNSSIPIYSKTYSIPQNSAYNAFSVVNRTYQLINDSLIRGIELPADMPSDSPQINIFNSGTERKLQVKIFPVRMNRQEQYERLTSFNIVPVDSQNNQKQERNLNIVTNQNSVLSSGYWYKIKVYSSGIYKITYSDLVAMGFTNLSNIRIYGNGGKQLSFMNSDARPVDLSECPVLMNKGSDGIFNDGDYILFYAEGPMYWKYNDTYKIFRQKFHDYSDASYYFLTTDKGEGKKIQSIDNNGFTSNVEVNSYNGYACYEKKLINLFGSGREWYSIQFDDQSFDTTFQLPGLILTDKVNIDAEMAGRSEGTRYVRMLVNDNTVSTKTIFPVVFVPDYNTFAVEEHFVYNFIPGSNSVKIGLLYSKIDLTDKAFLKYITVNGRCTLLYNQSPLMFQDINSVGSGNIARFNISNVSDNLQIWDITDVNNVYSIVGAKSGTQLNFKANAENLHQYIVFNAASDYPKPLMDKTLRGVGIVANQNLHNLPVYDYIIVTNSAFQDLADSLADYHRQKDHFKVLTVTPDIIYNEFSSGSPDVSALRDFFRYQYKNGNGTDYLKYVLLLGDGSYNNHMYVSGNTNYILTYQSDNSLEPLSSWVTDDFFGLLDDNEGESVGLLDIGIGRIPLKLNNGDELEAQQVIQKILKFYRSGLQDWRGNLTFVADDSYDDGGFGGDAIFLGQANTLAEFADQKRPGFELNKIFMDAYQQITSSSGPTYPDATNDLLRSINKGTLIVSYTGHGSQYGLASEKLLQIQDIQSLKNGEKLPVFITASCEFSRFDEITMNGSSIEPKTSGGEYLLLNSDGGAVALLSTTRVVNAGSNFDLGMKVFSHIFEKNANGERQRLGDIVRMAKNDLGADQNKLNFTILGDPAMVIQYPEYKVITDSVNGKSVISSIDTLKAFSKIEVTGHIAYDDSTTINTFNGLVYPRIYDKVDTITTLGNDGQDPLKYSDQKNLLYKGKASVKNGMFKFSCIIPKDISYSIDKGKISYYAENNIIDAQGEFRNALIGGTDQNVITDNSGPDIHLFMNDTLFKDGGITNNNPFLIGILKDDYGINTTGIGIGHDITAYLDNDFNNLFSLNEFYQANVDDFSSGTVNYPLLNLASGEHQLTLKAWDVFNNSAEATIHFIVPSSNNLVLDQVTNFPNPASEATSFQYLHNCPGEEHQIVLEIFDISGRIVASKSRKMLEAGFVSTPLEWDLRSISGNRLQAGIYPYRIKVSTSLGVAYLNQKLIIIR